MSAQIHFEIFVRRKTGGWTLYEALTDRQAARKGAETLLGSGGIVEVKVVKETLTSDGTYQSVAVFEAGEKQKKKKSVETGPAIPCFKPQDLYGPHARATMARVLRPILTEWRVTPIELIHSGDLLEKLEARSTTLQGAVQQVAVAMAADSDRSVQEIYRQLIDLCLRAIDRVVKDERKGRLKPFEKSSLDEFCLAIPTGADAAYLLSAAIAKHLRQCDTPGAKLTKLLLLLKLLPEMKGMRDFAATTIDAFISEIIRSPEALADLIGKNVEPGDVIRVLTGLFLGRSESLVGDAQSLHGLTFALRAELLPATMAALSQILLSEIKSPKRLHPSCFEREIETIRHLAQQLVFGVGAHLSLEDLTEAFSIRSRRLVTPEAIGAYLGNTDAPDEKIAKLISLEENVVGSQSKRSLASFILPLIRSVQFETMMTDGRAPATQRLQRLAQLQREASEAGFEDDDAVQIVGALGALAEKVEERSQLLRSIEVKRAPSADKAMTLMRLREGGVIPSGPCWDRACELIRTLIRKSDFAESLCPDTMTTDKHLDRREEFKRLFTILEIGSPRASSRPTNPARAESAA